MKAVTWLKVGGGVLVAVAAFAAADTRYVEVTGRTPWDPESRAIASAEASGCAAHQQHDGMKSGCCKKEAKPEENGAKTAEKHSGCCRK